MSTERKPELATLEISQLTRITIWGVGLIGGSLGLALKENGFQGERIGLGRNIGRLETALQHDAVDSVTTAIDEGIRNSDIVVVCTPVTLVPTLVKQVIDTIGSGQKHIVVTDVGSTKSALVHTVQEHIQSTNSQWISFVGGHPMAGSHETGVGAARANLFEDAKCLITPTDETDKDSLQLVKNLWEFVGAITYQCTPEVHDLLVGTASHLPHLIASILANTVAEMKIPEGNALEFTATGFHDSTRIAAGAPELWTGIFMQNRDVMLSAIDSIVEKMNRFKTLLKTKDRTEIERLLVDAQEIVLKQRKSIGEK
ncbi:MAG: prephenate dehydrogenase/arogenate dehydrogenase family protein [Candidatus Poribacteria bacterium]|nr:prephenate dehydrogenase/arogenate dehydrogenase family protein [Candidatus Poribacteria bacterium]